MVAATRNVRVDELKVIAWGDGGVYAYSAGVQQQAILLSAQELLRASSSAYP